MGQSSDPECTVRTLLNGVGTFIFFFFWFVVLFLASLYEGLVKKKKNEVLYMYIHTYDR